MWGQALSLIPRKFESQIADFDQEATSKTEEFETIDIIVASGVSQECVV